MKRFQDKQASILNSADLKTLKGKTVYWCMFMVLVIVCIICIIPALWVLLMGFKDSQEIYAGMGFFPKDLTFALAKTRIATAIEAMDFWKSSLNTLIQSLGDVAFSLVICGLGGYVLSRLKPTGSKFVFMLVVWTMMMPSQIRTVPLFISWLDFPFVAKVPGEVSLMNTYWPMWLTAAANSFNVMLFKNHFDSISTSYIEAAKLDGSGNGRIFFNIMLPMSGPILIYVTIMTMKNSWSDFFNGYLVLNDVEKQTLPVRIFLLNKDTSVKMNTYMLSLILSSMPTLLLYVVFQKHITGGVNVGGVKG